MNEFLRIDEFGIANQQAPLMIYGSHYGVYIDKDGMPVKNTPLTHNYSYDGFVVWRGGENDEITDTIYTDRLRQWDADKLEKLSKKHFEGQNGGFCWSGYTPESIEAFLRDWCEDPKLKLILVMEYCNMSTGFPLNRLEFKSKKK